MHFVLFKVLTYGTYLCLLHICKTKNLGKSGYNLATLSAFRLVVVGLYWFVTSICFYSRCDFLSGFYLLCPYWFNGSLA